MSFTIDRAELNKNPLLSMLDEETRLKVAKFKLHNKRVYLLTLDDRFLVFGDNAEGLLGLGGIRSFISQPVELLLLCGKQVTDIAVGPGHCLVLTANGEVYGFGFNQFGQIGIGVKSDTFEPLLIIPEGIAAVRCGSQFSLALTVDGRVLAWGSAKDGRLGFCVHGGYNQYYPAELTKLSGNVIVDIQVGLWHSFALSDQGHVFGWGGSAFYQLGLGRRINMKEPQIFNFTKEPIKSVRCGAFHTLFLTVSGRVYLTGVNNRVIRQIKLLIPKPIEQIVIINYRFAISNAQEDLLMIINKNWQLQLWTNKAESKIVSNKSMLDVLQNCATYLVPNEMFTVKDEFENQKTTTNEKCKSNQSLAKSSNIKNLKREVKQSNMTPSDQTQSNDKDTDKKIPSIDLALKMATAFHRSMDTDVEFVFPNCSDVIRAHRSVLMIASNYMNLFFSEEKAAEAYNQKGGFIRVVVIYFPYHVFGHYLRFLYTNQLGDQLSAEDLFKLTKLSLTTKDFQLTVACFGNFVKLNLCIENCCKLYAQSFELDMPEILNAKLLTFIIDHFQAIKLTEGFAQLDDKHIQRIHQNFIAMQSLK